MTLYSECDVADDITLLDSTSTGMEVLTHRSQEVAAKLGLAINRGKNKDYDDRKME